MSFDDFDLLLFFINIGEIEVVVSVGSFEVCEIVLILFLFLNFFKVNEISVEFMWNEVVESIFFLLMFVF